MHILFLNRSFYPDIEATGQLTADLCEALESKGYEISVICGKSLHEIDLEDKRGIDKKVNVIRVSGTTFPKRFLFLRLINLGTYYLSALFTGLFLKKKPDVIVSQTDPPLLGLLGVLFSFFYGAKFIYYCQDIYPDVGIISGKLRNPIFNFILTVANMISYKFASKIIVIGESMKKLLIKKGISEGKIIVIHNWADTRNVYPIEKNQNPFISQYGLTNSFTVMYSGNLGFTQNLEKVLDVANELKNYKDIKFIFIGDGGNKLKLEKIAIENDLTNVIFLPYQKIEDIKYSLSAADVHLIPFKEGLSGVLVPSKVYNILACGKPFIGWIDSDSEISDIAKKYNCGVIVNPGDANLLKESILWSYENKEKLSEMGQNGLEAIDGNFDLESSVSKFILSIQ